jgi:hypothetical protein
MFEDFFFHVQSAIIDAGYMGAPLVLGDYKKDERVRPPHLSPNRKWKYFEEKTTATLKSQQTSIATVRYHLLPVASLLTPLIFHYQLPLKVVGNEK